MRHKSHTSLLQKGWGLSINIAFLLLAIPLIAAYTPADYMTSVTNVNNPVFYVRVNDAWQELSIKYGLILEGGSLVYSDKVRNTRFFYSNNLVASTSLTAQATTNVKFNVSTIIPDNAIGFFYEFDTGIEGKYYPNSNVIVYPDKWHIYYKDLIKNFGKNNVVVEDNRILIFNVPGGKLLNFDPEGGGDGIPTDCVVALSRTYNITTIPPGSDFNMSGKYTFSGVCSGFTLIWQDSTSGTWATIPATDTDLDCSGATCTQSTPTQNVWYSKYIDCEASGYYYVRMALRYTDHLGSLGYAYTTSQLIHCSDEAYEQITLFQPENNTEKCLDGQHYFAVNVSSPSPELIHNITLYNNFNGTWRANGTWYQHFQNSSNVLHLLYFNRSNVSENKLSPDLTYTNTSLNSEQGFLGDYSLNFSNKTGWISYDDTNTLNLTYGTICLWLMPYENYGAESKFVIIDYPNTNENLYLAWYGSVLDWGFKKEHLNNNYVLYTTMNSRPQKNTWYHLCIAWDNSYSGIYVNGSLKASSLTYAAPTTKWGHLQIGGYASPADNCACVIDELMIYDRRMTDTQISNLYLQSNRTLNFTDVGSIPSGDYLWNAQAYYFPGLSIITGLFNYSTFNYTYKVRNCEVNELPLLFSDDKIKQDTLPFLIGFFGVLIVWLIIVFLLLWYRHKGRS